MRRAVKMCRGCPFRGKVSRKERAELAALAPEHFPCHEEAGYTDTDIQCRGHWELRRKAATNLEVKAVVMPEASRGGPAGRDIEVRPVNRKVWSLGQRCSVAATNLTGAVINQHASAFTSRTF